MCPGNKNCYDISDQYGYSEISPQDIKFLGRHFLDRNCCAFIYNKQQYKAIFKHSAQWLQEKNTDAFLETMAEEGFIPGTKTAKIFLRGFSKIYHQKSEYFNVFLWNANLQCLIESAKLWIYFNKWLYKYSLGLHDGHCANIIFNKAMCPLWCDIGSIMPVGQETQLVGIEEFLRCYYYPLKLREKSPYFASIAKQFEFMGMDHEMAKEFGLQIPVFPADRARALDILLECIESIQFKPLEQKWSSYYTDDFAELNDEDMDNHRVMLFCRIVKTLKPKSVVDIGANTGLFSRYLARQGAEVLAIEPDEQANFKHLEVLRDKQFEGKIKLIQGDIRVDAGQPGELAIALALTHHLFFTCKYPWKFIVDLLVARCTRHLLTEFMPWGLNVNAPPAPLPPHYNLQLFTSQLERYFQKVEVLSYPVSPGKSPRVFLLCTDKRPVPVDDGWGTFPTELIGMG